MSLPEWVDASLSRDLPTLRARGEGQELEFKREFPQQISDLAKDIAAFATSNTGSLLIGVADSGELIGLIGVEDPVLRDKLLLRISGVCTATIKPTIMPRMSWALEDGKVVLVVTVPRGSQPLYYARHRPYVRHLAMSRPAEPDEVVERVREHLKHDLPQEDDTANGGESEIHSLIGSIVHRALVWGETPARDRSINPWLDEWRADYSYSAESLRELAARDETAQMGLDLQLRAVADALDVVADFQLTLGCGERFESAATRAHELLLDLKRETVDKYPLSARSMERTAAFIRQSARMLGDLAARVEARIKAGEVDELKAEVGSLGRQLLELSFYDLSPLGAATSERLRAIAGSMRHVQVHELFLDGGISMQELLDQIEESASELGVLASELQR